LSPKPVTRIAVACADRIALKRAIDDLRATGASAAPVADLSELPAPCDVTLVFADGFPAGPLLACLERCRVRGPTVVVVSDDAPILPREAVERYGLVTIAYSTWVARGIEAVRTASAGANGQSGPELPFTD
jgi:hypothetical protein